MALRGNTFPSRANVKLYQGHVAHANASLKILKRKRDALELRIRELEAKVAEISEEMPELVKAAIYDLIWARLYGTDMNSFLVAPSAEATAVCKIGQMKLMGVSIRKMTLMVDKCEAVDYLSFSRDTTNIKKAQREFIAILEKFIAIGSLKLSIDPLSLSLIDTNTRVNGLEYVHIPNLIRTLKYIESELEERDREDFYRMKKIQQKKLKHIAAEKKVEKTTYSPEFTTIETFTMELVGEKQIEARMSPTTPFQCLCYQRRVKKRSNIDPTDKEIQTDF